MRWMFCVLMSLATPATAQVLADGRVLITQELAMEGRVTPGDRPGFPVTISRGGSYVLGSNLDVTADKNGISVTASNVTIDLNGFAILGNNGQGRNGIAALGSEIDNLTVRNGSIFESGAHGILAPHVSLLAADEMQIFGSRKNGITVAGFARVVNSNISANLGRGVSCGLYCHIEGNVISGNGEEGVSALYGLIVHNTINFNAGLGIMAPQELFGVGAVGNSLVGNNGDNVQAAYPVVADPNACYPECLYATPDD